MATKSKKIRVDLQMDKQSIKTRTDRAHVVATSAPKSPLYQSNPTLAASSIELAKAGDELAQADDGVNAAEATLATARWLRDTKQAEYDAVYGVYAANVERVASAPEEVTALGMLVLDKGSYDLLVPTEVQVRFDPVKGQVRIHVKLGPGLHNAVVDISTTPGDPASWTRLQGIGTIHTLSGYAPGTYWVRAATVRSTEQSEFTSPVSVIVK